MTAVKASTFRVQAVDDNIHDTDVEALQFPKQIQSLLNAQGLCQHDRYKTAAPVILEELLHLPDVGGESFNEVIEVVSLIRSAEELFHVTVFGQKGVQGFQPFPDQVGHFQEAQGMPRRRRIHDDPVIGPFFDPAAELQEGHEFVHPRQGKLQKTVDVLFVQKSPPGGDFPESLPVFSPESCGYRPGYPIPRPSDWRAAGLRRNCLAANGRDPWKPKAGIFPDDGRRVPAPLPPRPWFSPHRPCRRTAGAGYFHRSKNPVSLARCASILTPGDFPSLFPYASRQFLLPLLPGRLPAP